MFCLEQKIVILCPFFLADLSAMDSLWRDDGFSRFENTDIEHVLSITQGDVQAAAKFLAVMASADNDDDNDGKQEDRKRKPDTQDLPWSSKNKARREDADYDARLLTSAIGKKGLLSELAGKKWVAQVAKTNPETRRRFYKNQIKINLEKPSWGLQEEQFYALFDDTRIPFDDVVYFWKKGKNNADRKPLFLWGLEILSFVHKNNIEFTTEVGTLAQLLLQRRPSLTLAEFVDLYQRWTRLVDAGTQSDTWDRGINLNELDIDKFENPQLEYEKYVRRKLGPLGLQDYVREFVMYGNRFLRSDIARRIVDFFDYRRFRRANGFNGLTMFLKYGEHVIDAHEEFSRSVLDMSLKTFLDRFQIQRAFQLRRNRLYVPYFMVTVPEISWYADPSATTREFFQELRKNSAKIANDGTIHLGFYVNVAARYYEYASRDMPDFAPRDSVALQSSIISEQTKKEIMILKWAIQMLKVKRRYMFRRFDINQTSIVFRWILERTPIIEITKQLDERGNEILLSTDDDFMVEFFQEIARVNKADKTHYEKILAFEYEQDDGSEEEEKIEFPNNYSFHELVERMFRY